MNKERIYTFYVKEFENGKSVTIGTSKKDREGKWHNHFPQVTITKNVTIQDHQKAHITDYWIESYETREGKFAWKVVINGIEPVEEETKNTPAKDAFEQFADEMEISDEDLPF